MAVKVAAGPGIGPRWKGTYVPPTRGKYKRTTDLYTDGREVVLDDGNVIYLKALNPLERQECQGDAAAARSRLVLALEEIDSDETAKVRGTYFQDGRAACIVAILNSKTGEMISQAAAELRDEKPWKEKMEVLERSTELKARPVEDVERQFLEKVEREYLEEVNLRYDSERENHKMQYELMSDEALIEELMELWRDRRGSDAGENEFRVSELWHCARACDGVQDDDGTWAHIDCAGHAVRVWESKQEIAELPDRLMGLLLTEINALNMSVREAKNSDRLQSSSDSSLQPSGPAESTPSTPDETLSDVPGTSTSLSSTP